MPLVLLQERDELLRGPALQRAQERLPGCSLMGVEDRLPPPASLRRERPESIFLVPTGQSVPVYLIHQVGRQACARVHTHTLSHSHLPGSDACITSEEGTLHHVSVWSLQRHLLICILAVHLQSPPTGHRILCTGSFLPSLPHSWPVA